MNKCCGICYRKGIFTVGSQIDHTEGIVRKGQLSAGSPWNIDNIIGIYKNRLNNKGFIKSVLPFL